MKKVIGAAMLASAALTGAASAGEISGNVALVTDYVFRGVSLSDNSYAIQGGFDFSHDIFYAGVWGSSLSSGAELDVYAGVTPTTGPVEWDLGLIGYFYPGADDTDAEFDYFELMLAGAIAPTEQLSIGGAAYWAPDNYGETGDARYFEVNAEFTASDTVAFSGAFGNQSIEDPDGPFGAAAEGDYNTWNLGGTLAMHGFGFDLRYHDTDVEAGSDIESYTFGPESYDSNVVLTVSREL